MSDKAKETIIAEGTEFEGSIQSKCGITLDGRLKGELRAPSLNINKGGTVDGNVEVKELKSEGKVSGRIQADNVQLSGKVDNSTVIRAKTMEVKLAEQNNGLQVTFGECELKVGQPVRSSGGTTNQQGGQQQQNQQQQKSGKDRQPQKVGL